MGYLTKTWTAADQAELENKEQELHQLAGEISSYRRVQLMSHKDPKKKKSKIMWFHQKKKKRGKKTAKQKYRYAGYEQKPGYHWTREGEYLPDPVEIKRQMENERQRKILASEGVESVYRRKPKKKKRKIQW